MKSWAIGGVVVAWVAMAACGKGGSGATSTAGAGSTSTDPVCADPTGTASPGCVSCINDLPGTDPCLTTFATQCRADAACFAYASCTDGCDTGNMSGAGGGSSLCLDQGLGGAGGAVNMCSTCCYDNNDAGYVTFVTRLVEQCACAAGAPCAAACAM